MQRTETDPPLQCWTCKRPIEVEEEYHWATFSSQDEPRSIHRTCLDHIHDQRFQQIADDARQQRISSSYRAIVGEAAMCLVHDALVETGLSSDEIAPFLDSDEKLQTLVSCVYAGFTLGGLYERMGLKVPDTEALGAFGAFPDVKTLLLEASDTMKRSNDALQVLISHTPEPGRQPN